MTKQLESLAVAVPSMEAASVLLRDELYQKLSSYRDVDNLMQIGLVASNFLQWLDTGNSGSGSLFDLIPAYFEYQIDSHSDYNKAAFELQLMTLGLTPDCVAFIGEQATKYENNDKQDAFYYALQYCLHRIYVIYEIPLDLPLKSTPLNQIQPLDIPMTNDILSKTFQMIRINNFRTNDIKVSLRQTGLIQEIVGNKLLFHATQANQAVGIIHYGLNTTSTRLDFDSGPGFSLHTNFNDAKDWCQHHIAPYSNQQAAILVFQVPNQVYDTRNIYELDYEKVQENLNLIQWQQFVRDCRAGQRNNRAHGLYDGFSGPQCLNPTQLHSKYPKIRYTCEATSRVAWQINLRSTNTQAQIIDYLMSVLTFTNI